MKLAEALVLRADCQRKVEQLKQRLERVMRVQQGEQPAELPDVLTAELEKTLDELVDWIKKINKTNSLSQFDQDRSLSDALAERDRFLQQRNIFHDLLEAAAIKQDLFSSSEVKFYRTMDVNELQKNVDELSRRYRELDLKVQEKNWSTELIED